MNKKISKNKSIRLRLVKSFMLIIIITVLILEIALISGIKKYYYNNIEDILTNHLDFSINYLSRYLRSTNLEDIIIDDIDLFWNQTAAQIQVFDGEGKLILDSLGSEINPMVEFTDVRKALEGRKGVETSSSNIYGEPVMSISKAIEMDNKLIGVLRFSTSMDETNNIIRFISMLLISMGFIVVLISGIVSLFLANTIIKPLKEVTETAEQMADGRMDVRSQIELEDEIGQLSRTLNFMADEILKKEEIKNEFISSISHELKTPLTSIKGWSITLQSEDLGGNEILSEGLDIIEEESDRLTDMLEELLDFSRFASGGIVLRKEKINIKSYLNKIYKQLYPRTKLNGLNFELELDENLEYFIVDSDRLKQVLINLIDNSIKFSKEKGNIILKAYIEENNIIFKLSDDGIGIAKDQLPYIKDRFYKGDDSKSNTGIGLSIVDEIIKLHSGEIIIESNLGEGTIITIILPKGEIDL